MAEILPRHYIIGIILFTLFIVGGIAMIGEFRNDDPTFVDNDKYTSFNNTFNVYNNITEEVVDLKVGVENSTSTEFGALGVLSSLISTSWQTLKLIVKSLDFMDVAFTGMASFLGIPSWVGGLIILLVTTLLVFAIYSAIFQRDI